MKARLRTLLVELARSGRTATYAELAGALGLVPPGAIHRVGDLLEEIMQEDALAGRPLLSAVCVSRARRSTPARGFFFAAARLGLFEGDADGAAAVAFHEAELARVRAHYHHAGSA